MPNNRQSFRKIKSHERSSLPKTHLHPVDTGRKSNVHKTFRRRPGRLLNVLCTFNLRPVSTGKSQAKEICTFTISTQKYGSVPSHHIPVNKLNARICKIQPYMAVYGSIQSICKDIVGIYLSKVNSGNTATIFEICSKVTIKTPERQH